MARKHIKLGYSHSAIVDLRFAKTHKPAFRAGVMRQLERAGEYRLSVMGAELVNGLICKRTKDGTRFVTDVTPESAKVWARRYIAQAREWREEFAA